MQTQFAHALSLLRCLRVIGPCLSCLLLAEVNHAVADPAAPQLLAAADGAVTVQLADAPPRPLQFRLQEWTYDQAKPNAGAQPKNNAWLDHPISQKLTAEPNLVVQRLTWADQQLALNARYVSTAVCLRVAGELFETSATINAAPRLLTLMLTIPIAADGQNTWLQDIRHEQPLNNYDENIFTFASNAGARGSISRYPFGAVRLGEQGLALGFPIDKPCIHRVRYDGAHGCLVAEMDVALSSIPLKFPGRVNFEFLLWKFDAHWGFRSALQKYYSFFGSTFGVRDGFQGQWMPFTAIDSVHRPEDFRFAYHEYHPNVSVAYDNQNGIRPLVYCEPSVQYIDMPKDMPRTDQAFLQYLDGLKTEKASVVRSSGARRADGSLIAAYVELPWANGARVPTNCDAEVNRSARNPLNAYDLNWKPYRERAERRIASDGATDPEACSGLYLDSLEGWESPQLNFDRAQLQYSDFPLTFDAATGRVGQVLLLQNMEFTRDAAAMLHRRGDLLMANTALYRWCWPAAWLDVMGIETAWGSGKQIAPPPVEELDFVRSLCGQRPYCYLQNIPFSKFRGQKVTDYFARCLFYGFWPGFFSQDAASNPYWEDPRLYDADRAQFLRFMEPEGRMTAAGWQPVTLAKCSDPQVLIERWGGGPAQPAGIAPDEVFFTLLNPTDRPRSFALSLDANLWGGTLPFAFDILNGYRLPSAESVQLTLQPNEAALLWLVGAQGTASQKAVASTSADMQKLITKWQRHKMVSPSAASAAVAALQRPAAPAALKTALQPLRASLEKLYQPEFDRALRLLLMTAALPDEIHAYGVLHIDAPDMLAAGTSNELKLANSAARDQLVVQAQLADQPVPAEFKDGRARLAVPVSAPLGDPLEITIRSKGDDASGPYIVLCKTIGRPVIFVGLPQQLLLAKTGALEFGLRNNTPAALRGRLRITLPPGITCGQTELALTLPPGVDQPVPLQLTADITRAANSPGKITLAWEPEAGSGSAVLRGELPVIVLGKNASCLRRSDVQTLVDSTYFGYSIRPLTDGTTDTRNVDWSESAWASEDGVQSHWVEFRFAQPEEIHRVRLWWAMDAGQYHTSRDVQIQGMPADAHAWIKLGQSLNTARLACSEVTFAPQRLTRLRFWQPAGGGTADRPNILWLSEIEAN
jgi:hypothetical protein